METIKQFSFYNRLDFQLNIHSVDRLTVIFNLFQSTQFTNGLKTYFRYSRKSTCAHQIFIVSQTQMFNVNFVESDQFDVPSRYLFTSLGVKPLVVKLQRELNHI